MKKHEKLLGGLDLWVYTPQAGTITNRYSHYTVSTYNVYVILGCRETFKNIRSKVVGSVTIDTRVYGNAYIEAEIKGRELVENPDLFLEELIGTGDKRTKKYKEFVQSVNEFKAYAMTYKMDR